MPLTDVGVVLDVDGVLVRGSHVIPAAPQALQILKREGVPMLFVTNGGNMVEAEKAEKLSAQLGISIQEDQVILSHTPWRRLVPQYSRKRVLIIGSAESMDVAKAYGFENVVSPECFHKKNPDVYPVKTTDGEAVEADSAPDTHEPVDDSIHAAFIFSDSVDWGLHMQVLTDALLDNQLRCGGLIPVYACNADLVYTGKHSVPRFTQGAFVHAFQSLFFKYTGIEVPIEFCGKPFNIQYEYAEDLFRENMGCAHPRKFYGIGDNPKSDIRGANSAGSHWTSILVKTGVFDGSSRENDEEDPADVVVHDVLDAVNFICSNTSSSCSK